MARCKGCGRPILWITSFSRRPIPCDPEPVPYWEHEKAKGKIVTPNGMIISCDFQGDQQAATGLGYVPHWATCPVADQFRRKRQ